MARSRRAELVSAYPVLQDATEAVIDFSCRMQQEWIRAMAADYYRFWLEPYLYAKTGRRPKGHYFRIARVQPR